MSAPNLTPDVTGNPWVEVFFDPGDLDPDCVRLRIYRQAENRTWLVRGGVDIAPGVAALDFECPFQSSATYRAMQYDAGDAELGYTDPESITLDVEGTWIHNPLDPARGILVEMDDASLQQLQRPTLGELVYAEDAVVGRRLGSRRRGIVAADLVLNIDGMANIAGFEAMLGDYEEDQIGILCVHTSEPVLLPRTFFASSDGWTVQDKTIRRGGEWVRVAATVDEAEPPYPGLVVPLLTYDDLDAAYADYDDRDAAYATYTAQDRDYSLAGLATA